ncbi:MAG: alanine dehydrogenase [Candidatus Omnitrophota bacterium]
MSEKFSSTLILTRRDIEKTIHLKSAIDAVQAVFRQYGLKKVLMPPKVYLDLKKYKGDFRAMPAYIEHPQSCVLKWVNAHPDNPKIGLPAVMAVLILNDPKTGFPLSIMDATYLTAVRTGAAGAVAAKYLADKKSSVVSLVGCGVQAVTQLQMLRCVFPVKEVRVWGHLPGLSSAFIKRMKIKGEAMIQSTQIKECVESADIIVTTTPVRKPIVFYPWVKPGAHINAMGADAAGKEELDPRILQQGTVVIDDWEQASHSGEINVPLKKGLITKRKIFAHLGEIVAGKKKFVRNAKKVTVFDSTGLAIQDAAVAHLVYQTARQKKIGRSIHLF